MENTTISSAELNEVRAEVEDILDNTRVYRDGKAFFGKITFCIQNGRKTHTEVRETLK